MSLSTQWCRPATKAAAAVIVVGLGAGTGGSVNQHYLKQKGDLGYEIIRGSARAAETAQIGISADLDLIRSALKVGVSAIGKIFGVTRQSVYLWMRGGAPGNERAAQIARIAAAIEPHAPLFRSHVARVGQLKLESGETVVEALAAGGDVDALLGEIVAKVSSQQARRNQFAARLRGRPRMNRGAADNETSV